MVALTNPSSSTILGIPLYFSTTCRRGIVKQRTFFRKAFDHLSRLMDRLDVIGGNILWYVLLGFCGVVVVIFVVGMVTSIASKGKIDILKIISQ